MLGPDFRSVRRQGDDSSDRPERKLAAIKSLTDGMSDGLSDIILSVVRSARTRLRLLLLRAKERELRGDR